MQDEAQRPVQSPETLVFMDSGLAPEARPGMTALDQLQAFTVPAFTPWHTTSFEAQPASMTTLRLSFVTATGVRKRAAMFCFFGPRFQDFAPWISVSFLPPASCRAISAALRPSSRASLNTVTVWVPSATRLSAALSASWPETGTETDRPWDASA